MRLSIPMLAYALLTAAFLWPVEDAINGAGLHLVVLWLMLGMLHALRCLQASRNEPESRRAAFGLMDLGVLLIAVGHVISTVVVFQVEGDRRAALNLTFEWIGLFVVWRLFRSLLLDRTLAAQTVSLLIGVAVGLSVFGIWQHHFEQGARSAWYLPLRTELDDALSKQDGSGLLRVTKIVAEFHEQGIPLEALEGPARVLWENRLLSSTEPVGTFALANTLAGILAATLVLLIGKVTAGWKRGQRRHVLNGLVVAVQIAFIGYCLMLTKSRSAWAGAVVGLTVLAVVRTRAGSLMKVFRWGIAGVLAIAVTAGMAAFSGVLDKEVILESPRSLQFRLMYWTGAIELLKEHPLAGAGPGNFRQLYLQHKVDEASEEIRDPHNFVLDAWCSAGLVGFTGLLFLIASLCRQLTRDEENAESSGSALPTRRLSIRTVAGGLALGFGLHAGWDWINGYGFSAEDGMRLLLLAGPSVFVLVSRVGVRVDAATGRAAAAAMMVHLLAAGGFEMPAVMLLMLVCLALGTSLNERGADAIASGVVVGLGNTARAEEGGHRGRSTPGSETQRSWVCLPVAAAMLCGAFVVLKFGLMPVSSADRHLLNGDFALHRQRIPRSALESYRLAAESDPIGVTPRQRMAELEAYRLAELQGQNQIESQPQAENGRDQESDNDTASATRKQVTSAIAAAESLISADKRSCFGYRIRARCLAAGSILLKNPELMEQAIADQEIVTRMYPSSVQDWLELAVLSHAAESPRWSELARQAVGRAMDLERINRQWGHRDQFLTSDDLHQLKKILAE